MWASQCDAWLQWSERPHLWAVLVETSCSGISPVREVIFQVIPARFCDLVLEGGVKTVLELQDNCKGIWVPQEVDKVLKFINIGVNCSLALEIAVRLEAHKGMGRLIF
jgi:hypothetical protein